METWFLNHVLGLSLSLLLVVGLPRTLGAGTRSDHGSYHSTSADVLSSVENNATSGSYSSETLSPSQRNLLTHTAAAAGGNFDTEETFVGTSSRSREIRLSTEPLSSTLVAATTEASSRRSSSSRSSISSSSISSSSDSSSTTDSSGSSIGSTGSSGSRGSSSRTNTGSSGSSRRESINSGSSTGSSIISSSTNTGSSTGSINSGSSSSSSSSTSGSSSSSTSGSSSRINSGSSSTGSSSTGSSSINSGSSTGSSSSSTRGSSTGSSSINSGSSTGSISSSTRGSSTGSSSSSTRGSSTGSSINSDSSTGSSSINSGSSTGSSSINSGSSTGSISSSTRGSSTGSSSSSTRGSSSSTRGSSTGSSINSDSSTGSSSSISSSIKSGSSTDSSTGSSISSSINSVSSTGSSSINSSSSTGSSISSNSISSNSINSGSSSINSGSISSGSSTDSSSTGSSSSISSGSSTGSSSSISSGSSTDSSSSISSGSSTGSSSSISSGSSTGSSSSISSGSSTGSSSSINSGSSTGSSTGSSSSINSGSSTGGSSGWEVSVITDLVTGVSHSGSWKPRSWTLTEDGTLPQDHPDTTLRQRDATALVSQTAIHTDSTYTSSDNSRAGERTLLSVTSSSGNSTSSAFTEDSNSYQRPSTWAVPARATETEDYTHSAPSTRTDSSNATDEDMTQSTKQMISETGSPEASRGTQSLTESPNTTWHQHTSESEETSDSTAPPLRVTEPSTDQSDVPVYFTPPVTSPAGGTTNILGTELETESNVGTSTEASQGFSTPNQEGTEGLSPQTREESAGPVLTTAPPTVRTNTHHTDDSLTDTPVPVTEVSLSTTPVPVTVRSQITEEDTFQAFASSTTTTTTTTTIPPLPATSSSHFSSTSSTTTSSSTSELLTEATVTYTPPPTTASTPALQTTAGHTTRRASPSQTQGPTTESANPTGGTTLQIETDTLGGATSHYQYVSAPGTHSTTTRSTEVLHTTRRQSERGTTERVVTTSPAGLQPTTAPPPPTRDPCVSNPCMNGGMCVSYKRSQFTCHCQQAWTGPTCNQDMDECERDPCPAGSRCVNTRGSFSCECALGFDLEDGRTCTRAKTFLGTFNFNRLPQDPVIFKSSTMHEIQREIIQLLNASLAVLQGYSRSTLSNKEEDGVRIFAVNMFSVSTDVTSDEVYNSIQMSLSNCSSSMAHCRMVLHHQLTYHVESLCVAQKTQCDTERSTCTDSGGTAYCQCLQGYYKHNPEDLSCLDCGDGYKLENGTCVECMFGFGGFNCGNFYKLIAVVVSPAGGAMLLILIIALIVTCCKKDKNDINKIIFKSGDLQMSPYADFPKNNRISTEWGRETIEMQENGSTKNLLQMTDIYYSPALRNSDLERNGLYPFTGLPGSRHSCIYPAQWNPSFISDDSRRRDYF